MPLLNEPPPQPLPLHRKLARSVLMSKMAPTVQRGAPLQSQPRYSSGEVQPPQSEPPHPPQDAFLHLPAPSVRPGPAAAAQVLRSALTDTPMPSTMNSPQIAAMTPTPSGVSTPRLRPTTLDIPGLTRSKVSPDGKIAQRDVGAKLVIVMVGLPARGKSYITRKMARYLNWLQHDTKIFNVGERRRVAASSHDRHDPEASNPAEVAAKILINGEQTGTADLPAFKLLSPMDSPEQTAEEKHEESMDQSAAFFDPTNERASQIREQVAMETLDDLLDYILDKGGSVGIFDATNSTLKRRKLIMEHIHKRNPQLNVLFCESLCMNESLLESNMLLKLSGPDYKDKDPVASLADFKKRVALYEKSYVTLGDYEEENNMPYVKMVDVGRKVISHQIRGFLAGQAVYYLLNFNLAPRVIFITRHGESIDNVNGRIGGDSELSEQGHAYAKALSGFIDYQRKDWDVRQKDKAANTHFPPHPGDHTPPNPHYGANSDDLQPKSVCVWTSMLKRSIQTAANFDEEDYDVKEMRMLDELYAGWMEGMTYGEIQEKYETEYNLRRKDKLAYRYPGPGGEGYLDVINRVRPVITEMERMTDHCLLITHRSVARVLLAYFMGLNRDDVADLYCPLGMVYQLEPKPYGVEFKAYSYNTTTQMFDYIPDYQLRRAEQNKIWA